MATKVQVIVEAKDAASGILRGLTSQLGSFGGMIEQVTGKNVAFGNVAAMATELAVTGVQKALQATTEYAEAVRDQALASGTSAEAASRFLQVLDDYQLTAEDAKTATRALTKEGLAPTAETLVELSKEYNNLTTAEEKNAFVQEKLGRAGQEWLNLLSQGPDKIAAMNSAVSNNLILTDENIKAAEEYRLALDAWGDTAQGLQMTVGTRLIPVLTDLSKIVDGSVQGWFGFADAITQARDAALEFKDPADQIAVVLTFMSDWAAEIVNATLPSFMKDTAQSMDTAAASGNNLLDVETDLAVQAKAVSDQHQQFIGTLKNIEGPMEDYKNGLIEADQALADGKLTTEEHAAKVDELAAKYEDAKSRIVLSIVEMKLAADGWTDAELTAYLKVGEKLGVFTEEERQAAMEAVALANTLVATGEPIDHVGTRAAEAADQLAEMKDAQAELAQGVRSDSLPAINGLKVALAGLPVQTTLNVDVFIKTHGSIPSVVHNAIQGTGAWQAQQWLNRQEQEGKQSGGAVYAPAPYLVGENGAEPFIPSVNGRILSHFEALHALTVAAGQGSAEGLSIHANYGTINVNADREDVDSLYSAR